MSDHFNCGDGPRELRRRAESRARDERKRKRTELWDLLLRLLQRAGDGRCTAHNRWKAIKVAKEIVEELHADDRR